VGSPAERGLLHEIAHARQRSARTAADTVAVLDSLDLPALCGVLALSDVGNDSGVRHLAAAVGTPTVGIYWIANVITASPLGRTQDRVMMAWTTHCPACGRDCTRIDVARCEHHMSFVADISPDEVIDEIEQLLADTGAGDSAGQLIGAFTQRRSAITPRAATSP
jgi:ADP-heptose:LPS heptosyltransferase